MNNTLILSSLSQKENGEWPTPICKVVHSLQHNRNSQHKIVSKTSLPQQTIRQILYQESSWRVHGKKAPKPYLMSIHEIRCCIRYISRDWSTHRMLFEQVRAQLGIQASARTICRELYCAGYRCCIVCPRLYISHKQAKKRLGFALEHQ